MLNIHMYKKIKYLRIGIDIDSIILTIEDWIFRLVKRGLKVNTKELKKFGYFIERSPLITSLPNGERFIKQLYESNFIYENAKPIPGALETLTKWKKYGHKIWFITARPKDKLKPVTNLWFDNHNLSWAKRKIIFMESFSVDRSLFKKTVAEKHKLQVLIDDHAETLKNVNAPSIIKKIGLKYSWNENEDIGNNSILVDNWKEIDQIVEKLTKKRPNT